MSKVVITRIDNGFVLVNEESMEEPQTFAFVSHCEHGSNDCDPALREMLEYLSFEVYHDLCGNKWGEKRLVIGLEPGKNYEKPE